MGTGNKLPMAPTDILQPSIFQLPIDKFSMGGTPFVEVSNPLLEARGGPRTLYPLPHLLKKKRKDDYLEDCEFERCCAHLIRL